MEHFNGKDIFAAIAAKFDYIPRPHTTGHVTDYDVSRLISGLLDSLAEIENVYFTKPNRKGRDRLTAAEFITETVNLTIADYRENYERPAPADLMRGLQDIAATLTQDAVREACAALEERVSVDVCHFFGDIDDLMTGRLEIPRNFLRDLISEGAMIISQEIKKEAAKAA